MGRDIELHLVLIQFLNLLDRIIWSFTCEHVSDCVDRYRVCDVYPKRVSSTVALGRPKKAQLRTVPSNRRDTTPSAFLMLKVCISWKCLPGCSIQAAPRPVRECAAEDMRTPWQWSSPEGTTFQRHILYCTGLFLEGSGRNAELDLGGRSIM
ncbi:hypothetical protein EI94DRAFT_1739926, partial [Lactarius quietus]